MHKNLIVIAMLFGFVGCGTQVADQQEHVALELTPANFQSEVLDSSKIVLVDFWGPN